MGRDYDSNEVARKMTELYAICFIEDIGMDRLLDYILYGIRMIEIEGAQDNVQEEKFWRMYSSIKSIGKDVV
jgi:hypothetical protein